MIQAVVILGGIGLMAGIGLAVASKIFYVYVDPKILAVEDELPGANCGGCGLPGCSANAEAIVAGKASPNSCVAAGPETGEAIAAILGVAIEAKEPDIALPGCTYGVADADTRFIYSGVQECRAAALLFGGTKVCKIGCLGLGSCERACPFDAIVMGPQGLPVVDMARCTGCGTCERVCPKNIITLSSVTRRILHEYTTADCTTPCQRACPAGIDICAYIRHIHLGDFYRAVQVIKERNPFPTVIGRICPRPCEEECRRQYIDEPVAINYLKRYAADYEKSSGQRILPFKAPPTDRKVAVVGGGVQGLSTAFFTARLGHETTVFEAEEKLGGLLRKAIARERLPMDILDWDIDGVLEMGITAETGQMLGRDYTVDTLLNNGFDAIFLASGGWDSRLARSGAGKIEQPIPGTHQLIDVMQSRKGQTADVAIGSHVVIVGGGSMALETALWAKEKGAQQATVLFREDETTLGIRENERSAAESQGIEVRYTHGVTRLYGRGNQLTSLDIMDLKTGAQHALPVDSLWLASGRFPELIIARPQMDQADSTEDTPADTDLWEAFPPFKNPMFHREIGLLSQSDTLSDYSAAIKAIGAGRRAAAAIHYVMYGLALKHPTNVVTSDSELQNVDQVFRVQPAQRQIMPLNDPMVIAGGDELEKGFDEATATAEAGRCLQCGLICYQQTTADTVETETAG